MNKKTKLHKLKPLSKKTIKNIDKIIFDTIKKALNKQENKKMNKIIKTYFIFILHIIMLSLISTAALLSLFWFRLLYNYITN